MPIAQMPENCKSTAHSRKSIMIRFCLIFLMILGIIFGIRHMITTTYHAKAYPDRQTVEAMFEENREDFDKVAEIFVHSDIFQYLRKRDQNAIFSPSIPKWNEHFTKEEYAAICDFFNRYKPYEIGHSSGNPKFVFFAHDATVTFRFYAGESGDSQERFLIYIKQYADEVIDLQNGWYCGMKAKDTVGSENKESVQNKNRQYVPHQILRMKCLSEALFDLIT